jgi:hypothetical protein
VSNMPKGTRSSIRLIHKTARHLWISEIMLAMLIAGIARAQVDEIRIPEPATVADNACAIAAAYALMHAEAEISLYIRSCGENPNKIACEETVRIMNEIAGGGSYGLTCLGGPDRARATEDEENGPH